MQHGAGASFTVAENDGWTPAIIAAHAGHAECLRVLAEHGAGASFTVAENLETCRGDQHVLVVMPTYIRTSPTQLDYALHPLDHSFAHGGVDFPPTLYACDVCSP